MTIEERRREDDQRPRVGLAMGEVIVERGRRAVQFEIEVKG